VGDLKRVLTNVTTRGAWGEVQLEIFWSDSFPEQYSATFRPPAQQSALSCHQAPGRMRARCGCHRREFPVRPISGWAAAASGRRAGRRSAARRTRNRGAVLRAHVQRKIPRAPSPRLRRSVPRHGRPLCGGTRRPGLPSRSSRTTRRLAGPTTFARAANSLQMASDTGRFSSVKRGLGLFWVK